MKLMNKKAQSLNGLQVAIMGFAGIAVTIAITLYVLAQLQYATTSDGTSTGTTTVASNATGTIIDKMATIPTWIGILIVVVFATAVLGYFFMRQ